MLDDLFDLRRTYGWDDFAQVYGSNFRFFACPA
jgi:hypothetical protein